MLKAFKYRLYPSKNQKILLEKHFGAVRLLWNLALDVKTNAYKTYGKTISHHELATSQLRDLKDGFHFFKEVNSQCLQASLRNLDVAYKRFFKKQGDFPRFKNKQSNQSFTCPQHFSVKDGKLNLPKFDDGIEIILHRPLKGIMRSATISKTASGKYFASILCETLQVKPAQLPVKVETTVGIDLGLKSFIFCSDGYHVDCPKHLRKSEVKLKYLQRELSRKTKGSKRREVAKIKVARQHEIIANQRKDFSQKESAMIAKSFDTVCFEDLNVKGMTKNHCLAKSINDAGWADFVRMVEYKMAWKGGTVLRLPTFEPSSKVCHKCGHVNHDLKLSDREWDCPYCGEHLDRDLNAAIVIMLKCLNSFFLPSERRSKDVEVSSILAKASKRAVETSKVLVDMENISSCLVPEAPCL